MGGMNREVTQVKNKLSDMWVLPAPGTYLGTLGYGGHITPSRVRHVLIQITD